MSSQRPQKAKKSIGHGGNRHHVSNIHPSVNNNVQPLTTSFLKVPEQPLTKWKCPKSWCNILNNLSADKCEVCESKVSYCHCIISTHNNHGVVNPAAQDLICRQCQLPRNNNWKCSSCTFKNNPASLVCEMCEQGINPQEPSSKDNTNLLPPTNLFQLNNNNSNNNNTVTTKININNNNNDDTFYIHTPTNSQESLVASPFVPPSYKSPSTAASPFLSQYSRKPSRYNNTSNLNTSNINSQQSSVLILSPPRNNHTTNIISQSSSVPSPFVKPSYKPLRNDKPNNNSLDILINEFENHTQSQPVGISLAQPDPSQPVINHDDQSNSQLNDSESQPRRPLPQISDSFSLSLASSQSISQQSDFRAHSISQLSQSQGSQSPSKSVFTSHSLLQLKVKNSINNNQSRVKTYSSPLFEAQPDTHLHNYMNDSESESDDDDDDDDDADSESGFNDSVSNSNSLMNTYLKLVLSNDKDKEYIYSRCARGFFMQQVPDPVINYKPPQLEDFKNSIGFISENNNEPLSLARYDTTGGRTRFPNNKGYEPFCRKSVYFWLPKYFPIYHSPGFEFTGVICPQCNIECVVDGFNKEFPARLVVDVDCNFMLVGQRVKCRNYDRTGCKYRVMNTDPEVIQRMPRQFQLMFPAIVTHRGAISKRLFDIMRLSCATDGGFERFASVLHQTHRS